MSDQDKPYFEGYFVVVIAPPVMLTLPIDAPQYRALEWQMAECNIPHETEDRLYCMIAMLPQIDASTPAILEMAALQNIMPDVVKNYGANFHEVNPE